MAYYQPVIGQGFIGNMLELRNQRLRQSLAEAQMQNEAMQQLGAGIGSFVGQAGKGFFGGLQQAGQDKIANRLMNEQDPPAATAVDPAMQAQFTGSGGVPHTGGMTEMGLRMKMEEQRMAQMRAQADQDQVEATRAQHDITNARNAWKDLQAVEKAGSSSLDKAYKERIAYIKEDRVLDGAINKAEDPASYQAAVDRRMALSQAAIDKGIKGVEPLDPASIQPFMTKQEKQQLADQRQSVADAQKAIAEAQAEPMSGYERWLPDAMLPMIRQETKESAIQAAQEKFKQEQDTLLGIRGATAEAPSYLQGKEGYGPPGAAAATGETSAESSKYPVGHRQRHPKTGKTRVMGPDGEWIYGQ